jgi:hypothetical protein
MKRRDSLRRRAPYRQPLPRILIVCEGKRTEPEYFREMKSVERALVDLDIRTEGKPKQLVERAVELKRQTEAAAERERDENLRYDEVWCVFDIDTHKLIAEASQQAKSHRIELAISNPCFELWVLLHFQDQRAHILVRQVQRLCAKHLPEYEKKVPYAKLRPHYMVAVRRAKRLEEMHAPHVRLRGNPSTGVYRLTERIMLSRA